jgi:hypothetical protein
MSCCGKKRNNALGTGTTTAALPTPGSPHAVPAGPAHRGPVFEYLGGHVLTVTGQASGLQYRFVGHGARTSVDPRDRHSMQRVPLLRLVS